MKDEGKHFRHWACPAGSAAMFAIRACPGGSAASALLVASSEDIFGTARAESAGAGNPRARNTMAGPNPRTARATNSPGKFCRSLRQKFRDACRAFRELAGTWGQEHANASWPTSYNFPAQAKQPPALTTAPEPLTTDKGRLTTDHWQLTSGN
jgi:hypothetical protein